MVVQNILILSVLITNVLSAPSSCIESCDSYIKQYQTQTSGSFQNHVGLSQSGSYLQGLDYSKPGTWSEHNDYNTDNGHGKVHEERGQYVEGPKTVRYYKRNNTYSHSTSYPNSEELLRLEHQNNKHDTYIPTQNSYDKLGNTESIAQQYKYNRMHNQQYTQSSHRQTKTQSERLEDLGEYSGGALQTTAQNAADLTTQISQEPHHINTQPGNWSTVDSYKTDGGHGRVFEEQGQYVSGDKNVRYYKRNYTSNYSSSDGTPIPETINTRVHDVQREIEKFHKEFEKEFRHISTTKTIGSSNIAQTHVNNHGLPTDSIYNINNNNYKDQNDGSISSATNHNEEQHTSVITNQHLPYRNPYQNSYGTNSYSTYEKHEGYAKKFQPISQLINPISGYTTNVLTTADSDYKKNIFSDSTSQQITGNSQTDILDEHQSKLVRNQMFLDNLKNSEQRQNRLIHSGTPGHTGQYKEYWTSRHIKEESIPQHSTDISHINQHNLQYNNNQYANTHNLHQGLQQSSNLHKFAENSFDNIRKTQLEKLVVGTHDISRGADVVDCASNSQHSYGSSQYQTRYKRNVNYDKQEKVEQQERKHFNDDFTQETLHTDYPTHQTSQIPKFQRNTEQSHQPWKPGSSNQRLEDLMQTTDGSDDITQQTAGNLEFDQESQQSYQPWKIGSANHRLEDLTQKTDESDDLTQQTFGNLEFGQESQQSYQPWKPESANHRLEDHKQTRDEFEDLTQQTTGNLEFGQESQQSYQPRTPGSANHRLDGLTQKTDGTDDLTQQTSGNLELEQESQQSYQPWTPGSANHRLDDLTQKTDGLDDLTQQTSGNLEFGQESQQSYQPWKPGSANHQLEDLTQKTDGSDDLTQQTAGNLEFGQESQQSYQPWKPGSANHRLDDLTQKTDGSDDLTQKTAGNLEFGQEIQQSYQPWKPGSANHRLGDLTQKTDGFDDLTQQTSENLEFGQNSQQSYQTWKPGSANQELGDITDHELASHSVKPAVKPKPRSRYSRFGPSVNLEISNQNAHNIDKPSVMNFNGEDTIPDIYELPPEVGVETDTDNTHNTNAKEDQMRQNVRFRNLNQLTDSTGYDIVGGNVDQVSLLHKSNDATVGLQWHYTYHPSDQRQFVQQTDQKNKEGLQQESKIQFSDLEQNLNQEIQNKYTVYKPHRQLELPKQSQNYAFESEINPIKRTFNYDQTKNKLIIDQQLGENEEKYVATVESEPKPIPRILETYGGGQYDPTIDDSIYSKVTINPSATLSSTNDMDSWDIREKLEVTTTTTELTPPPLPVQPLDINDTTETPQSSSFWSRVGNKITTTFGKAKEKARHIFG